MATPLPSNRARFALAEIALASRGRLVDLEGTREVVGVSTDSRAVAAGNLFVALRGESFDGHAFAAAARAAGAVPLVTAGAGIAGPRLEVPDSLHALGDLAGHFLARERAARPLAVLAVGGAAGKTTTKSLCHAAVEALFGATGVTAGNLNNRIGVPLTLLALAPNEGALVVECGTSEPGEIARLAEIVAPDAALVLNVDFEHSERLGDLEAIADEEAALFAGARSAVVTLADEPRLLARLPARSDLRRVTFGTAAGASVAVAGRELAAAGATRVRLAVAGELLASGRTAEIEIDTALLGSTAAINLAAALAGAIALRARPLAERELAAATAALGRVPAVPGRLALSEIGGVTVLDDSYNANPRSVRAAVATALELADRLGLRLVVALGEMLELGDYSAALHREVLAEVARARPALLFVAGPQMTASLGDLAPGPTAFAADDAAALAELVVSHLHPGDLLLVKGSRGMRMERLIAAWRAATGAGAA